MQIILLKADLPLLVLGCLLSVYNCLLGDIVYCWWNHNITFSVHCVQSSSSLESNLEGLAAVLDADLPNYKSKILNILMEW